MSRRPTDKRARRPIDPERWRKAARVTLWQRIKRWCRVIRDGF